jgi:hypothetical protein
VLPWFSPLGFQRFKPVLGLALSIPPFFFGVLYATGFPRSVDSRVREESDRTTSRFMSPSKQRAPARLGFFCRSFSCARRRSALLGLRSSAAQIPVVASDGFQFCSCVFAGPCSCPVLGFSRRVSTQSAGPWAVASLFGAAFAAWFSFR